MVIYKLDGLILLSYRHKEKKGKQILYSILIGFRLTN